MREQTAGPGLRQITYILGSKDEKPTEVLEPIDQTGASREPRRERLLLVFIQLEDLLGKVCWIPFLPSHP